MHVALTCRQPGATVHWEDDCLTHVVRRPDGRAVSAHDTPADAAAEAARNGPGWLAEDVCFTDLDRMDRRAIGGCRDCRRGPCSIALMPGEVCECGCGCCGTDDPAAF